MLKRWKEDTTPTTEQGLNTLSRMFVAAEKSDVKGYLIMTHVEEITLIWLKMTPSQHRHYPDTLSKKFIAAEKGN